MRRRKRVAAILLSLAMTVLLAVPALAQEGSYSITITPTTTNHTYSAYQIFAGDISGNEGEYVLSDIQWGSSVNEPATFLAALKDANSTKYEACTTAAQVAEQLTSAADLEEFLGVLNTGSYLGTAVATQQASGTSATISLTEAGYYLVKDNLTGDDENEFVSDYIVQVLGNVSIAPKGDVPGIQKKVKDINDSQDAAGSYGDWQDSADYDIGDDVPFQITATVGSDYDNYETYAFTIHDEQSDGLTFHNESVVVKVDGTTVDSQYYSVETSGLGDGCTFHVVFANLKSIGTVHAGSTITVEYTSQLNENAVIGALGNPNETYLEYSNNPNGTGTGKTPRDTVIVFTYKVDVNKVDGDNENAPLAGAAFKLEKKMQDGSWVEVEEIVAGATTTFEFKGLDDGTYRLTETTTPQGYNSIDAIEFTVTATHDPNGLTLTGLEATDTKYVDGEGQPIQGGDLGTIVFTRDQEDSDALTTTVANFSGTTLPETGGIGTTIFFVLGGLLVIGAGVLLVVRIRMKAATDE